MKEVGNDDGLCNEEKKVDDKKGTYVNPVANQLVEKDEGDAEKINNEDEVVVNRTEKFQPNFMTFSVMQEILVLD